jgi:integrase
MTWPEVDFDTAVWTIPPERAKNGRQHRVPLTDGTADVLRRRLVERAPDEARVFPGFYHQRQDLLALRPDTYRWHDLRRTVATRLAALGFPDETIGRVLNHAKRGVTATVYNQYAYDREKRQALEAWAREVARLVNTEQPRAAAVVPIRR